MHTYRENPLAAEVARIIDATPVVPVLTFTDEARAVAVAGALVAGGLAVLEVTLRTEAALRAVRAIAAAVPGAVLGVGTVLDPSQLEEARDAGARFAVSPGSTPRLLDAADALGFPLLPGAATASEVMALLDRGYTRQKLFPAEPAGGMALLKSLAEPLPQARFCPTGGINASTAAAYLALPNVVCVGGSWVTPKDAVAEGDVARIESLARAACELRKG
jgi:2-dehydro-3-deoxyphosphogluconate aldolase/(4S)-4-hydroxy-2-oxoglutarate aldolase